MHVDGLDPLSVDHQLAAPRMGMIVAVRRRARRGRAL
jgi:hypothetical protein